LVALSQIDRIEKLLRRARRNGFPAPPQRMRRQLPHRIFRSAPPRPARAQPHRVAAVLLRANMKLKKLLAKSKARY
jgi:hypothetical protein